MYHLCCCRFLRGYPLPKPFPPLNFSQGFTSLLFMTALCLCGSLWLLVPYPSWNYLLSTQLLVVYKRASRVQSYTTRWYTPNPGLFFFIGIPPTKENLLHTIWNSTSTVTSLNLNLAQIFCFSSQYILISHIRLLGTTCTFLICRRRLHWQKFGLWLSHSADCMSSSLRRPSFMPLGSQSSLCSVTDSGLICFSANS